MAPFAGQGLHRLGRRHRLEEADQRDPVGQRGHLLERRWLDPGHDGCSGQGGGGGVDHDGTGLPVGVVGEAGRFARS